MLVKLLGSALILGATTMAGWQVAARFARRPAQLRDLQTALAVLQTEIEYGATPLPAALEAAAAASGTAVAPLFVCAAARLRSGIGVTGGEAMREAVQVAAGETALAPQDLDPLLALSSVLGATGRSDQVRHLRLARERLAAEEARAREEQVRFERVARYMGVLSGAALVLILL